MASQVADGCWLDLDSRNISLVFGRDTVDWAHLDVVSLVFALSQVHQGLLMNHTMGLEVTAVVFAELNVWLVTDLKLTFVAFQVGLTERVIHSRSCLVVEVDALRLHWDNLILVVAWWLFTRWVLSEVSSLNSVCSDVSYLLGLGDWRVCLLAYRRHSWSVCSLVSLVSHLVKLQRLIVSRVHRPLILSESVRCWV